MGIRSCLHGFFGLQSVKKNKACDQQRSTQIQSFNLYNCGLGNIKANEVHKLVRSVDLAPVAVNIATVTLYLDRNMAVKTTGMNIHCFIFTFLVYLLKSPILMHWNIIQ